MEALESDGVNAFVEADQAGNAGEEADQHNLSSARRKSGGQDPGGRPPVEEDMLVQIWVDKPGMAWRQTFGSVEEAVEKLEKEESYERD